MSLAIQISKVRRVLLSDGWHDVEGNSFDLDSYEFMSDDYPLHGGGQSGISATGFSFSTPSGRVCGPLSSIQAVETFPWNA